MTNNTINHLISQFEDGLSDIMKLSYPHCKDSKNITSVECAKINDIAFTLKKKLQSLQYQYQLLQREIIRLKR